MEAIFSLPASSRRKLLASLFCPTIFMAFVVPARAEIISVPIKIWEVRIHVESGHIAEEFRLLGPLNKARAGRSLFITLEPPEHFKLCYFNVAEVNFTGGGARAGYNITGTPADSGFQSYTINVGAEADGFPSWAGNTSNIRVRVVAIRQDYAEASAAHASTELPVLYPSKANTSKLSCPQNIHKAGSPFGPTKTIEIGNPSFWRLETINVDTSRPSECPVGGFPAPGQPNHDLCKPK